jgi:phage terminase large subunit-like protein
VVLSPADTASKDPTTAYARAVLAGEIVAGPHVRASCRRHLKDLEAGARRGLFFDAKAAQRAIDFFPDVLTVEVEGETVPFELLDWQVFVVGSLFGWKRKATGFRRFSRGYVEGGKGCGKSPFAAGIGLLMQVADNEQKAEVYSAAAKKEQAHILFQDAVSMVDSSPLLRRRIKPSGKNPVWQLTHRTSGSIFKPIAADKQKSGPRVHCGLVDELHEHKDRYTVDMLIAGFKGRRQPLLFIITNSGFDRNSICFEWHENAIAVAEGTLENDSLFSYVMALDIEDDPFTDPSCWPKTNPGVGITTTLQYMEDQVRDAIQIPGRENVVRRLCFCEWTDADQGWMTRGAWTDCEEPLTEFRRPDRRTLMGGGSAIAEGFEDAVLYVGLDLAFRFDLNALAFAFPEDDKLLCWIEYFKPVETLEEAEKTDRVPYRLWVDQGLIHAVPGKIVRPEHIAARLAQVQQSFDVRLAAYDNYAHKALRDEMAEEGVLLPWIEHPQGFRRAGALLDKRGRPIKDPATGKAMENPLWMPQSVNLLEGRVIDKTLRVQPSPVTRWQVSSVVVRDDPAGTGNRVFDKAKAVGRIDGIVALAQAVGAADARLPSQDLSGFLRSPVVVGGGAR